MFYNLDNKVKRMIDNSIKNNKIFSSYIFHGVDRKSKLEIAKYLSSALNCLDNSKPKPCGECKNCLAIADEKYHSFMIISKELELSSDKKKKSISVEDIRLLRREILEGSYQGSLVIYVDKAEDLTPNALNGLLKILEDAPENVFFIFDVANKYSLLSTIRSRSNALGFCGLREVSSNDDVVEFISVDKFSYFIENSNIKDLLLYAETNKIDRSELKDFLIRLEAYYLDSFKNKGLKRFLDLSVIVRKFYMYLNRPVNVINNLGLMFLEMKGI